MGKGDGPQSKTFDLETPDFTTEKYWLETDDFKMIKTIRDGKGKDMPDFKKNLNTHQIEAMVDYIKRSFSTLK